MKTTFGKNQNFTKKIFKTNNWGVGINAGVEKSEEVIVRRHTSFAMTVSPTNNAYVLSASSVAFSFFNPANPKLMLNVIPVE